MSIGNIKEIWFVEATTLASCKKGLTMMQLYEDEQFIMRKSPKLFFCWCPIQL